MALSSTGEAGTIHGQIPAAVTNWLDACQAFSCWKNVFQSLKDGARASLLEVPEWQGLCVRLVTAV